MTTASAPSPTSVSLQARLTLSEKTLAHYQKEANDYGVPLEELLSHRLTACVTHNSGRPLYFDDAQRQQIEKMIGRNVSQPSAVIQMIEKLLSFRINGMSITLKPEVLSRLRTRHNYGEFTQWLSHQIQILLEQYAGLR